jgi:hypothetical protein
MSGTNGETASREYANQLRDAIALARCAESGDQAGFNSVAKSACNCTMHALALLLAACVLDIAEERDRPADDIWRDLLDRIDEWERP